MTSPKNLPRAIVYAELDDEIALLFERIRAVRPAAVALVVPARARVLQSLVNLKILRHKAEQIEKTITIVTIDTAGRGLATQAGFAVAEKVVELGRQMHFVGLAPARDAIRTTLHQPAQTSMGRRILSLGSGAAAQLRALTTIDREKIPLAKPGRVMRGVLDRLAGGVQELPAEEQGDGAARFVVRPPDRRVLFALIAAAVTLLFFVSYIAVPSATVYITPRADPIQKTITLRLATSESLVAPTQSPVGLSVPATFLDTTFDLPVRIGATGQIFNGSSATGEITVFNTSPRDKFIVPSRFLSVRDQIIFRSTRAVTIPAAVGGEPGRITVPVVACEKDDTRCDCINAPQTCQGNFVGARGNIEPAYFTMPAIPSLSPALYYAESSEPFSGGVTDITKFVRQEDLDAIPENVLLAARAVATARLQEQLDIIKLQTGKKYLTLLDMPRVTSVEVVSVDTPEGLLDTTRDDFTVGARIRVTGVAYDEDILRGILFDEISTAVHPEKQLNRVDFAGVVFRLEEYDYAARTAQLAVTVTGVEEFTISELTAEGARLTEKIRNRVLGQPINEAERFIRNLPEVSNAVISSWPFWARTLPELPENVTFRMR